MAEKSTVFFQTFRDIHPQITNGQPEQNSLKDLCHLSIPPNLVKIKLNPENLRKKIRKTLVNLK